MRHRVGLVGLRQARHFVDLFNRMPDTQVTAICDTDAELVRQVGEETGIRQQFTDLEAMLQTDIDVVELSTPIQVHGQQAIAAMKHGKHVLCQYVAARNPEEGKELARVAKQSGKKYMFIETDCYERKNLMMAALAARGVFGDLTMGRGHYIHDCKALGRHSDGSLTWRGHLWMEGRGGTSAAVHSATPLLQIFGERAEEIYAYGPGARTLPEFNWYDCITTAARLPSGRTLEFVLDVFSWRPLRCGYYLQGTHGCFEFDRAALVEEGKLSPWKDLDELERQFGMQDVLRDHGGHVSAFEAIVREFIRAIDQDTRPPQDLYDALHITAIGWAVDESLATRKPVKVISFE